MACTTSEGQLSREQIHTYVHVFVFVCSVYNATPSSQGQNPYFTKKMHKQK